MRILVTGRDGQVGRALQQVASQLNVTLIALSRSDLDITDAGSIQAAFDQYSPDLVINAAAYTAVDKAEEEQAAAFAVNRDGPGNLAVACSVADIPFLHISTDFVFDGEKSEPYCEDDTCSPLSVYGKSKWDGENEVISKSSKYIILRTSWVFGGEQNFVMTMRRLGETRNVLNVVDDQRGGPTASDDIARSLITIAKTVVAPEFNEWGIYHYSGNPSVSWFEFACEILKDVLAVTVEPIPSSSYPTPARRPANSVLNCRKIHRVFGIRQPDWITALTK